MSNIKINESCDIKEMLDSFKKLYIIIKQMDDNGISCEYIFFDRFKDLRRRMYNCMVDAWKDSISFEIGEVEEKRFVYVVEYSCDHPKDNVLIIETCTLKKKQLSWLEKNFRALADDGFDGFEDAIDEDELHTMVEVCDGCQKQVQVLRKWFDDNDDYFCPSCVVMNQRYETALKVFRECREDRRAGRGVTFDYDRAEAEYKEASRVYREALSARVADASKNLYVDLHVE